MLFEAFSNRKRLTGSLLRPRRGTILLPDTRGALLTTSPDRRARRYTTDGLPLEDDPEALAEEAAERDAESESESAKGSSVVTGTSVGTSSSGLCGDPSDVIEEARGGSISLSTNVCIRYRSVSYSLPTRWLEDYMDDWAEMYLDDDGDYRSSFTSDSSTGGVSSIATTLDNLWVSFRYAAKGKHSTFYKLLGCYNMPRKPLEDTYFWANDWGSPLKVYLYCLQLVYTYSDYIKWGREDGHCAGFETFAKQLLEGREVRNNGDVLGASKTKTCSLTVNFRNADSDYPDYVHEPCTSSARRRSCDTGFHEGEGDGRLWREWDDDLTWAPGDHCYAGDPVDVESCPYPDVLPDDQDSQGNGGVNYMVTFHPILLAFRGFLCDRLMHLGRMAFDYAIYLYNQSDARYVDYLTAGTRLARYALRSIAGLGATLVHEIGHVYVGSGHCEHKCCFQRAAEKWKCKVRGTLGLPQHERDIYGKEDWEDKELERGETRCGGGADDHLYACNTIQEGVAGQDASYCSYGCYLSYTKAEQERIMNVGCLPADPKR